MIKNFESVKQQLKELAEIVNSYKSEAVQLRLVELVLGARREESPAEEERLGGGQRKRAGARRRKNRVTTPTETEGGTGNQRRRGGKRRGSLGPVAAFGRLYRDGFFKSPRTISDVVEQAETKLATKIKQSDVSGILARYSRDEKLHREKNDAGQYEYTEVKQQPSA